MFTGINMGLVLAHLLLLFAGNKLMDDENRTKKWVPAVLAVFFFSCLLGIACRDGVEPFNKTARYADNEHKKEFLEIYKQAKMEEESNAYWKGMNEPDHYWREQLNEAKHKYPHWNSWTGEDK